MFFNRNRLTNKNVMLLNSEFQHDGSNYLLVSTNNPVFQPFIGNSWQFSAWQLLDTADISHGVKYNKVYNYLIDHLKKGNNIFSEDYSNLILDNDEYIKFQSYDSVYLNEARAVRVSNSRYAGSRSRGAYTGASYGIGVSQSESQSYDEIKTVDVGQITITNKRFIFSGEKKSVNVPFKKIISITPYSDAIKLERKGKQKVEYFTNIDHYIFTREHDGEVYFFMMDGTIMKSIIEGSLDGLKHISDLQLFDAQSIPQSQNVNSSLMESFKYDDVNLKYLKSWSKIPKRDNNIFTIENNIDGLHCEINISKGDFVENMEFFKKNLLIVFKQKNFSTFGFRDIRINGIDMSTISLLTYNNEILIESIFTYFNNNKNLFTVFLSHPFYSEAKNDYFNLINSIQVDSITSKINEHQTNYCINCGTKIEPNSRFCINCGLKLE